MSDPADEAPSHDLSEVRVALDRVDRALLDALAERVQLVTEVARRKASGGSVVRDPAREEALLGRLVELGKKRGLEPFFVTRVFREILDHSLRVQHELLAEREASGDLLVVGFQGGEGAFSHLCAQRHFSTRGPATFVGFESFRAMLEAVRDGRIDEAVLPIENTTAGSINESYDLLSEMDLHIVGEEAQPVVMCLIGLSDVPLASIRRVLSHPVALAQCGELLRLLDAQAVAFEDTALAVAKVKADGDLAQAAIASEEAARLHGLPVLRRGVQDQRANFTRMVVVAREPRTFDLRIPCKTSVVFATRHERGALARGIAVLATHGLNLTKLESRPRPNTPWEYHFYLDFEGNLADPEVATGLDALRAETSWLRVLGCYAARTIDEAKPAEPRIEASTPSSPPPSLPSPVRVGAASIGARPALLAGPASPEGDMVADAREAKGAGASVLYAPFELANDPGEEPLLDRLVHAAGETSLPLALAVTHPADAARLASRADLLLVDVHHATQRGLLEELGRLDVPVLLSRAITATLDEWLDAAGLLARSGNGRVILLDAGVRVLGRRTLDLASLPVVRQRSAHPVLVDLSVAEDADALALGRAALAAGAQGFVRRSLEGLRDYAALL